MLDFTFDSPRRFLLNEIVSRPEPGETPRAPTDRRKATSAVARKRRRHDGLSSGKRAPTGMVEQSAGCRAGLPRR